MSNVDERGSRNLELALDLYEAGEELKRQSLRRSHPEASEEEVESMIVEWLQTRPGAEHGDCPGRRITLEELSNR